MSQLDKTPEYHRKPEWEAELAADYSDQEWESMVPCRVTFVALCHPRHSNLDFNGVGDFQGTVGSRLESGLMEKLGFKAVIVESVDPGDLTPDPMFTPEGGI